ncbi:MAG TPA: vanadium-dependent haloperoxidase [Nocardioidaceae bacterium]|nr:vanadium-dependent haloperoxidase [Nocardioidaceae bacterium]
MRPSRMLAVTGLALLPLTVLPSQPAVSNTEPSPAMTTLLDWQMLTLQVVYVDGRVVFPPSTTAVAVPPPIAPVYLGFTSLAVNDAVQTAAAGTASSSAAIAAAAHDVLEHYFPNTEATLDAALTSTLAKVPDGPAQRKGVRIGRHAAAELIASRAGEVLGGSVPYTLDPAVPGNWTPPPTGMLASWLGYIKPLVVQDPADLPGPDALTSAEYAADFNEVKLLGSKAGTNTEHKAIADFYYANSTATYERALVSYLRKNPIGVRKAAKLFAVANVAQADAIRVIWKNKLEIGFWRPVTAIPRAGEDNNPATVADPTWEPYRVTPPYSDYASGHGAFTGAFAEAVRMYLGNDVPLTLVSVPSAPLPSRSYSSLSALESEAFMARIYSGIHFRKAMQDAYDFAHTTAHQVAAAIG